LIVDREKSKEQLIKEVEELYRQIGALKVSEEQLRQEKEAAIVARDNLRKLTQQLPIGVQIFDANGLCVDVNEAYMHIFGVRQREQLVDHYNILTDQLADRIGLQSAAHKALVGQVTHLPEVVFDFNQADPRFSRTDGQRILSVTFVPIHNVSGEVTQIVTFNEDITERKQVKEELRFTEERFRQVISSISDHIYVSEVGEHGNRINLYLSPHIEAMTGYPHQEFIEDWRFWPDTVIHPDDRAAAAAQAKQLAQGHDSEVEYRLVRADGKVIWVRDRARVEIEGKSKIIYALVSDITAHKMVELEREWLTNELRDVNQTLDERVRARTAELQAILDAAGEGIVVTDLAGVIQYVNPALEQLTGYSEAEALGNTPRLWSSRQQDKAFYAQMWQTIRAGQNWRGELVNKGKDGSLYHVLLTITPIRGPDGKPFGFVGMQNDITPFKEMDRLKSEFISTAAHELRTPLTSIQGFSEILLTRQLNEERRTRYLTFVNQQAEALAAIIDDLLDLSRLEAKQSFEIADELVNIKEILEQTIFGFQENNPEHRYTVSGPEIWPSIKGDPAKLAQLFKNLFSNATKYSPDGGEVVLQTAVESQYDLLHLTLTDRGVGMTKEQLAHIFDRFYRADASNTAIGGTGLGMTISRLIVEGHGGKIWVESEYGIGTTVHLLLPLPHRSAYILVIEDDDVLREVQQRSLELQGFTVLVAAEGKAGLELACISLPDLILLDLALPGMTGFTVLDKLQADDVTLNIPVIITSAMDKPEDIEKAIAKGVIDYLVKPYSMHDLTVRVNRALTEARREIWTSAQSLVQRS
jgi:PAS domain S-box-containing protein